MFLLTCDEIDVNAGEIVKILDIDLGRKIRYDTRSEYTQTPLHLACRIGDVKVMIPLCCLA